MLLVSSVASAGTATLNWTVPTTNTDGSAITGPVTYNVYKGTQGQTVKPLLTSGLTGTSYTAANLAGGTTVCFNVTAVVGGVESAYSNEGCKLIPLPIPNPPVLTVAAVTAFSPQAQLNSYKMVAVGKVPNGTPCISNQYVNGLHAVDRKRVKWSGSFRPSVVVAQCG